MAERDGPAVARFMDRPPTRQSGDLIVQLEHLCSVKAWVGQALQQEPEPLRVGNASVYLVIDRRFLAALERIACARAGDLAAAGETAAASRLWHKFVES